MAKNNNYGFMRLQTGQAGPKKEKKRSEVKIPSFTKLLRANRALDSNCKEGFVFMESVRELCQASKSLYSWM